MAFTNNLAKSRSNFNLLAKKVMLSGQKYISAYTFGQLGVNGLQENKYSEDVLPIFIKKAHMQSSGTIF